jgi:hypothetical protein
VPESESDVLESSASRAQTQTNDQTQTQSTSGTASAIRSYEENAGNIRILVGFSRSIGFCSDNQQSAVLAFTHVCRIDKVFPYMLHVRACGCVTDAGMIEL